MMNIEDEKELVAKLERKNSSDLEYAQGMLAVLTKVAEGMAPEEIRAFVNNSLLCYLSG